MTKNKEKVFYAKRKLEFQRKQVKQLGKKKDSRYFEQLSVLEALEKPYYLYSEKLPVREETWTNKYHNFLSNLVRSPFYNAELETLNEL